MVILMQKALEKWQEENTDGGSFYDAMDFILEEQQDAGMTYAPFAYHEFDDE